MKRIDFVEAQAVFHRGAMFCVLLSLPAWAGCSWNSQLEEARRQAAACRLELEALKQQNSDQPSTALLKAQRDRFAAQCEELKTEVAQLKDQLREAHASGIDSDTRRQLDEQRRELETALAGVRRSREEWEQGLADRQRKIDILTNQVERLQQELEKARGGAGSPASRPGS